MGYHKSPLKFIELGRHKPPKISLEERKSRFKEIYQPPSEDDLQEQANRCLDCGSPYCEWKCPVHNYIPDWLALANEGRVLEAVELCHSTNSLPEVCGRICPQDLLCEGACTLNDANGAVTIGEVEKYITETAFAMGWKPDLSAVKPSNRKVAIVGAGPAGLACADVLARNGIEATVFDQYPQIGGLLTFGIPSFKLEKTVMERRRRIFEDMGIKFRLNCKVGVDISIQQIEASFDAVFLAMGTYKPVTGTIKGTEGEGVHLALDYLIGNANRLLNLQMKQFPFIDTKDQKVIVLGGGDTAMDCNRTSIRLGAKSVKCAYRRDELNMPGSKGERTSAKEEGVEFLFNYQPIEIINNEQNKVQAVKFVKTAVRDPIISKTTDGAWSKIIKDSLGFKNQRLDFFNTEEEIIVEADKVIVAFGFQPNPPKWLQELSVSVNSRGMVQVNSEAGQGYRTDNPKVFSGGDMIRGADLVVTAIHDGREAGRSITQLLLKEILHNH